MRSILLLGRPLTIRSLGEWILRIFLVPVVYFLILLIWVVSEQCALEMENTSKWCSEGDRWWNDCLVQPGNTFTSGAYTGTLWVTILSKRESQPLPLLWGMSGLYTGLVATFFHGSNGRGVTGELDVASIPVLIAITWRCLFHYRYRWRGWTELIAWMVVAFISHLVEFLVESKNWDIIFVVFVTAVSGLALTVLAMIIRQRRWWLLGPWTVWMGGVIVLYLIPENNCDWGTAPHGLGHLWQALGICSAFYFCYEDPVAITEVKPRASTDELV